MQEKLDVNFTNKFNQDLQKELLKLEERKKEFAESLRMSSEKKQRYTTNPLAT